MAALRYLASVEVAALRCWAWEVGVELISLASAVERAQHWWVAAVTEEGVRPWEEV